ncbi:MAG: DNA topology modulation protein [Pleurocapsa sp. SU_5_0]|nr:DNA topology modulation protein [Pleurocapsa sp. SU_5_0]NJO97321.1 DNA topology modulation protein [Pleurocapsa sp. CRU_1_2]NJR46919.1 DNA topology modulation protein [Hyellaceae cyanobacterium CSU_1_1]
MAIDRQKIAIIGSCGAGKSTLAVNLGKKLDLPVIHLDAYYWQSGWQETNTQQWLQIQEKLIKNNRWIIDGNYGNTMDIRLAAADTVIWLDFNRYLCLWRVFQRYLKYPGKTRPDMAVNCPERLTGEFIEYVWNFPQVHRSRITDKLAQYQQQENKQIIILQNPHQVIDLLEGI